MDIGELDTEWYSRPIDADGAGREDWLNSENSKATASLSESNNPWVVSERRFGGRQ